MQRTASMFSVALRKSRKPRSTELMTENNTSSRGRAPVSVIPFLCSFRLSGPRFVAPNSTSRRNTFVESGAQLDSRGLQNEIRFGQEARGGSFGKGPANGL